MKKVATFSSAAVLAAAAALAMQPASAWWGDGPGWSRGWGDGFGDFDFSARGRASGWGDYYDYYGPWWAYPPPYAYGGYPGWGGPWGAPYGAPYAAPAPAAPAQGQSTK